MEVNISLGTNKKNKKKFGLDGFLIIVEELNEKKMEVYPLLKKKKIKMIINLKIVII